MLYQVCAQIGGNGKVRRFETEQFHLQPNGDYSIPNLWKYFTIEQQSEMSQFHSLCGNKTHFTMFMTNNILVHKDGKIYIQRKDGSLEECEKESDGKFELKTNR